MYTTLKLRIDFTPWNSLYLKAAITAQLKEGVQDVPDAFFYGNSENSLVKCERSEKEAGYFLFSHQLGKFQLLFMGQRSVLQELVLKVAFLDHYFSQEREKVQLIDFCCQGSCDEINWWATS